MNEPLITAEQFDSMPVEDGQAWELLDGELIEVSGATYRHNRIVAILISSLAEFLRRSGMGGVVPGTEFALGPQRRLRPDVALLLTERLAKLDPDKVPIPIAPNLAVEVVSPSESALTLRRKIQAYLDGGVEEVWVIYPATQQVDAYRGDQIQTYRASQTLRTALLPQWELRLSSLFETIAS